MLIATSSTSISIDIQVTDDSGLAVTGLVAATLPAISWSLNGNTAATAISLSDLAAITTAYSSGGVKERSGGYYRLDLPNAALTTAGEVTLIGDATGKHVLAAKIIVSGTVTAGTVSDKTGYALTQAFPSNFSSFSIDGSGRIDIGKALGIAVTLDANNVLNVSTKYVGGTLQTARDIGASVLLSSGTGAGQISLSSGAVLLQATQTGVTIPTVTTVTNRVTANSDQLAGQTVTAAAGVTFPSSVASPTNITAGTITTVTNLTNAPTSGDFTATMKTSLNAATPASVAGSVGSVTGNVGGNVVGTVGSVVGAVGSVTGNVGGVSGVTFPSTVASPTNITAGTITTVTNLTNAPTAGDFTAAMKTSLSAATPVCTVSGDFSVTMKTSLNAATGQDTAGTATLLGRLTAQRGTNLDNLDGSVSGVATAVTNMATSISPVITIANELNGMLTTDPNNGSLKVYTTAAVQNVAGAKMDLVNAPNTTALAAIGSAVMFLAGAIDSGAIDTPAEALRVMLAALAGKVSGAGTTSIAMRDTADTKNRISATVDSSGDRTALVYDAS